MSASQESGFRMLFCVTAGVALGVSLFLLPGPALAANPANAACMGCHGKKGFKLPGQKMANIYVNPKVMDESVHGKLPCASCHVGIRGFPHKKEQIKPVPCGNCHPKALNAYSGSSHEMSRKQNEDSRSKSDVPPGIAPPTCSSCHGAHDVAKVNSPKSPVFPLNQVKTCGGCHQKNARMVGRTKLGDRFEQYVDSVHGRGLSGSGLVNSATCSSCHGGHAIYPSYDLDSSVSRVNATATCGKCHVGVVQKIRNDVHFSSNGGGRTGGAVCTDCHSSHTIRRTERSEFHFGLAERCGECHATQEETYRRSMHGKAVSLRSVRAPNCSGCHQAHLMKTGAALRSNPEELRTLCERCHPGATVGMVSFRPHADSDDPTNYPYLYWTKVGMHALLASVLGFFAIHTILWVPRSWLFSRRRQQPRKGERFYYRFNRKQRATHLAVVISFVGLALTGIPLRFSHTEWAQWLASTTVFASREVAGGFHRFFAVITFGYAIFHLVEIFRQARASEDWKRYLFGPDSMIPKWKDFVQVYQHFRYFVGLGQRPHFGRWTYWEKFDYWAVFWGVAIIGASGLLLWNPVFFTRFLPGWVLNIAEIIHSEEALLAVTFIFIVHFYHNTLRSEKFPMDTVMVTGKISEEEFKLEHPSEFRELKRTGRLAEREAPPPTELELYIARIVLGTGLFLGVLVIIAVIVSFVLS